MHRPQNRTAALLAAFGCALAYLPAGRALAAVCAALPLSAAGQSFALHCAAAPLAEELVFRGAVQGLLQPLGPRAAVCVQAALFAVQHGGAAGIAYALVLGVLLEDLPPLCVSLVQRRDYTSAYIDLLRSYLMEVLGGAASLPPRRGRPAKPFYNFPVLSSTAAKPAAPVHPAPGTQLPFAGATNFRELGGYPADEGKTVRWGQIWRGVCTARLTDPADRARLDALGLRLILDLRSTAEAQAEPDYVPDGARLVQICALCGDDGHEISFAPGDIERMMRTAREGENILYRMYRQMLFGNKAFKELFRALEAGETPILFHCSAGKDRTGVAAMLILLALGASDETICADFVQTNVCRKAEIDALLAGHAEEIAADPSKRMRFCTQAGVDPGAAPYVLQVIREACGSAEEYLAREYGLTPARRMRLRRMYLE